MFPSSIFEQQFSDEEDIKQCSQSRFVMTIVMLPDRYHNDSSSGHITQLNSPPSPTNHTPYFLTARPWAEARVTNYNNHKLLYFCWAARS